jgi:hypothetical protein
MMTSGNVATMLTLQYNIRFSSLDGDDNDIVSCQYGRVCQLNDNVIALPVKQRLNVINVYQTCFGFVVTILSTYRLISTWWWSRLLRVELFPRAECAG